VIRKFLLAFSGLNLVPVIHKIQFPTGNKIARAHKSLAKAGRKFVDQLSASFVPAFA